MADDVDRLVQLDAQVAGNGGRMCSLHLKGTVFKDGEARWRLPEVALAVRSCGDYKTALQTNKLLKSFQVEADHIFVRCGLEFHKHVFPSLLMAAQPGTPVEVTSDISLSVECAITSFEYVYPQTQG